MLQNMVMTNWLFQAGDAMDLTRRQREQRKKEIRNKVKNIEMIFILMMMMKMMMREQRNKEIRNKVKDINMIFILIMMMKMMMKCGPSSEDNNQANTKTSYDYHIR